MSYDIQFDFEQLSVLEHIDKTERAGDVDLTASGFATIEFDRQMDWKIGRIDLDVIYRARTHSKHFENGEPITINGGDPLFELIEYALRRKCTDDILDAIKQELDEMGSASNERETRAEMRRGD